MTLKVIGAGFGRMGTRATKDALEMLGVGPCHHMAEVFAHLDTVAGWLDALRHPPTTAEGWAPLLGTYASCVDWPSCYFWKELAEAYPDAKVLLSTRDHEKWWASIDKTIFEIVRMDEVPEDGGGLRRDHFLMVRELIRERTFGGNVDDKDHVLSVLRAHEDEVRQTVPADRLLVWSVTEGWEPLCAFLEVPVPDAPFPSRNTTQEFRDNLSMDN
jgi:hypothetical protein